MLSRSILRASTGALGSAAPRVTSRASAFHTSRILLEKKESDAAPGSFARTDDSITVEYPEDHELPSSKFVQGRGGQHMKRTLAAFSLEGRVGVVTGGARGLGLVMGQGMVISGANLAIVDMNSEFLPHFSSNVICKVWEACLSRKALRRLTASHSKILFPISPAVSTCDCPLIGDCTFILHKITKSKS